MSRCDILVASLPSTPQTTYLLKAEHLSEYPCARIRRQAYRGYVEHMPDKSVLVNVGRGDLVHSGEPPVLLTGHRVYLIAILTYCTDDVIAALDAPGGLTGAALDVTDPEPLPDNHPLYTHPRVIITPHTSGAFKGYNDAVGDLLVAQAERLRGGGRAYNVVNFERGY